MRASPATRFAGVLLPATAIVITKSIRRVPITQGCAVIKHESYQQPKKDLFCDFSTQITSIIIPTQELFSRASTPCLSALPDSNSSPPSLASLTMNQDCSFKWGIFQSSGCQPGSSTELPVEGPPPRECGGTEEGKAALNCRGSQEND